MTQAADSKMLSDLAGTTGLSIQKLTNNDSGKMLASNIYYLESDVTLNENKASKNGLKIAENATVYIYIPKGMTLTVYGQDGTDADVPAAGAKGSMTLGTKTNSGGITYTYPNASSMVASTAGMAGSVATGGGAAIYVPQSAKLAVLGEGTLCAKGGKGGDASQGAAGTESVIWWISQYTDSGQSPQNPEPDGYTNDSRYNKFEAWGTASRGDNFTRVLTYLLGSGGTGGSGAGGGGAAIGTNGADGTSGLKGAIGPKDNDHTAGCDPNKSTGNTSTKNAENAGTIYLASSLIITKTVGGAGGNKSSTSAEGAAFEKEYTQSIIDHFESGQANHNTSQSTLYIRKSRAGGNGGAGGNGAACGAGGAGGAGGLGGDSGSIKHSKDGNNYSSKASNAGTNGQDGSNGTANTDTVLSKYPYNTITFGNNTPENYYLTQKTKITAPEYTGTVDPGKVFAGWKVTTAAQALPTAFGETACGLAQSGTVYKAGDPITATGIYGNVTLTPVIEELTYSVTMVDEDGTHIVSDAAKASDTVNIPAAAEKKGHHFDYWEVTGLTGITRLTEAEPTITVGTDNVTLKAHYEKNSYTLTVNNASGTTTQQVEYDTPVELTPDETLGQSWFKGWTVTGVTNYTVEEGKGEALRFQMPDGPVTVTANYEQAGYKPGEVVNTKHIVTVTNGEKDAVKLPYEKGDEVTLTAEDVDGKTFTGWTVEGLADFSETPAKVLTFTMPDNDVAAVAHYRKTETAKPVNTKHIITVTNGEKDAVKLAYEKDDEVTLTAEDVEGKTFTGWTVEGLENDFSETPAKVLTFTMPDNDVTAVAHYRKTETAKPVNTQHIVTVTNGEKDAVKLPYEKDDEVTLTAEEVEGKTFTGWTVEGLTMFSETPAKVLTFTMPDNDVTVVAHYRKTEAVKPVNTQHIVTVKGGTAFVNGQAVSAAKAGETVTITADASLIPEGMTFDAWNITPDRLMGDLNVDYKAEMLELVMPDEDLTAEALYRSAEIVDETDYTPLSIVTGVAAGTVAAGVLGWQAYNIGTELYLKWVLLYIPSTRAELALLIWEQADKPEPASVELFEDISADDTDAQKAARWMVEQKLMEVDEDTPAQFHPLNAVTRLRICRTWNEAKEKGLVK